MLNELDKELEREGFRYVRYADDYSIYAKSTHAARKAGWAVAQSPILGTTVTLDRLRKRGYEAMLDLYHRIAPHLNEPLYTRPYRAER